MRIKRIEIDPRFNAYYDSFYLLGIKEAFPKAKIVFRQQPVLNDHKILCINVIFENGESRKYAIDSQDVSTIYDSILGWTDVYAKVNLEFDGVEPRNAKVVSIPPSFGIRYCGFLGTVREALLSQIGAMNLSKKDRIDLFKGIYRQYKFRLPMKHYDRLPCQENFIFFTGGLWLKETKTNTFRLNFIRASKSLPFIQFEGGFAPRAKDDMQGFEQDTMKERVPFQDYLYKLKKSFCVFNTPAVASCHGWKLGEFMALGKTIISTPLTRQTLPLLQPMVHYYPVDGSEASIVSAIIELSENKMLAQQLADNIYNYYKTNASPEAVMRNLLK